MTNCINIFRNKLVPNLSLLNLSISPILCLKFLISNVCVAALKSPQTIILPYFSLIFWTSCSTCSYRLILELIGICVSQNSCLLLWWLLIILISFSLNINFKNINPRWRTVFKISPSWLSNRNTSPLLN